MNEAFLFYVWQFQYYNKSQLLTTDGEEIVVVHPGTRNSNSGPDFSNARIRIGGIDWVGNVEIHVSSSEWFNHHHHHDLAYENVILHVVWKNDKPVLRNDKSAIPTLELCNRVGEKLLLQYRRLVNNPHDIKCAASLALVRDITKISMLDRALMQRLEYKALSILRSLERNNNDWDQTCFEQLSKNFGFKLNAEPFEQLARAIPYRLLLKHADNILQVEALLFGQSGMLDQPWTDDYFAELKREYLFLSKKYSLEPTRLKKAQWRFLRMRPANFPTVRMAQFAALICGQQNIFSEIIDARSYRQLQHMFSASQSAYWRQHYNFFKPAADEVPALGSQSVDNILINSVVPLLVAYGQWKDEQFFIDLAVEILGEIEPEKNAITKQWTTLGIANNNAADSQALIELYNTFCMKRKCLDCSIGFSLIQPLVK